jgi:hypothetical protein
MNKHCSNCGEQDSDLILVCRIKEGHLVVNIHEICVPEVLQILEFSIIRNIKR